MPSTLTLAQLAPTSLAFDAKVLTRPSNGGKYVETTLAAKRFPLVQLSASSAPLRAPFGLSTKFEGDGGNARLTLDLDAPPELVAWATALDEHLIARAIAHSKAWFGKELTEATVRAMHAPLVRQTNDKYAPVIRVKVHPESVKLWRQSDRAEMKADELVRGVSIVPVVSVGNVWFMGRSQFGISLGLSLGLVTPGASLGLDAFILDEPEAEEAPVMIED